MDPRREVAQIHKHFTRYHHDIGESLLYYVFNADTSQYDDVYDEGFRQYHTGIRIPILWVDQAEAVEDYAPEGRRPTERCRCAVSARDMREAGISIVEAHGNRLTDDSPSEVWREDRMHDIFYYNNRFWEIAGFQIRGRVKGEDVIIGISGIETFLADDMVLDIVPGSTGTVLIEDPPGSNLYRAIPGLVEDPDHPGLYMTFSGLVEDPAGSNLYRHPSLGGS